MWEARENGGPVRDRARKAKGQDVGIGPGTLSGWGDGIDLAGGSGSVRRVTATGDNTGILLRSAGNDVRGNVTTDNIEFGGIVAGVGGNAIIGNYAHGNGTNLGDTHTNCDSNVWLGSDVGTSSSPEP